MKYFVKLVAYAPIEMLRDDSWLGKILGVLMSILYLGLTLLAFWGLFWIADNAYMPRKEAYGYVTGKTFTPALSL